MMRLNLLHARSYSLAPSPHNAGIVGMSQYFPRTVISQSLLEKADGVSEGKYRKGESHPCLDF